MNNKENFLFNEWKNFIKHQSDAVFVTDGVVNPEQWDKVPVKVLYLLKEVNGGDSEWDERDYLANYNKKQSYIETHSPTIDILLKWQYGINYGLEKTWNQVNDDIKNKNLQNELLSQICLVNIKKTAGGGIVDWDNFDAYFSLEYNKKMLKEQLSLYKPNVVICGGTAWHLCQIQEWDYNSWRQTSRGIRYHIDLNTIYIDFCHPNNRGPKNMIYFSLLDALKELKIIQ